MTNIRGLAGAACFAALLACSNDNAKTKQATGNDGVSAVGAPRTASGTVETPTSKQLVTPPSAEQVPRVESGVLEPTTKCEFVGSYTPPAADCASTPKSITFALPQGYDVPTFMELVGGTIYAGFEAQPQCISSRGCFAAAPGVFRTADGPTWETVIENDASVLIAPHGRQLYGVHSQPGKGALSAEPIHSFGDNTRTSRAVGGFSRAGYVAGMAATSGFLYSLVASTELGSTTLERRAIGSDGSLAAAETLQTIPGLALRLRANKNVVAWTEPRSMVVAAATGKRQHVAALPSDTAFRLLEVTDRFAFTMYEQEGAAGWAYSVCALDLATGEAEIIVPPRKDGVDVRGIAANSSHLFWIEARYPDSYQLWAQPLSGGAPSVVACAETPIHAVAANDDAVYWIGHEVHRLRAESL